MLAINRCKELGQVVKTEHYELTKWREVPLDAQERTLVGVRLNSALDEQFKWLVAIEEELEKVSE